MEISWGSYKRVAYNIYFKMSLVKTLDLMITFKKYLSKTT